MLEIKNLTITINTRTIIENLNLSVNLNDKLAIIGEEGNGKSTLLKTIAGVCDYTEITGTVNYKNHNIGYLEQFLNKNDLKKSVKKYLFNDEQQYYNKINNFYKIISDLNIDEDILNREIIEKLSGGEKIKIQLLKVLLDNPDILLLDEPTNDLDIETLEWLEKLIINTNKPVIFISYDETLLSKTANVILHLELLNKKRIPKHTVLKIGYDEYVEKRINFINKNNQLAKNERKSYEKQMEKLTQIRNKVEYQQNTISRSDPHGARLLKKKMKNIKSQEKRINENDLTKTIDYEEAINIFFEKVAIPSKKEIINLELKELKVGNKVLSKNIKLNVIGTQKIVIIGKNGVGKTNLLRYIYSVLSPRKDLIVGYMPQNYDEVLDFNITPIDFLATSGEKDENSLIRSYMGNLKFTSEEMTEKIRELSGGSKAKLILLKLILQKCNVLILDEPTRNISPLSNPVIRKALINFNGTIISVSHDRKFIGNVPNLVYELTENGLAEVEQI